MKDRFHRYYFGEMGPEEAEEYRLWLIEHEYDPELEKIMAEAFAEISELGTAAPDARRGGRKWLVPLAAVLLLCLCLPLSFLLGRKSGKDVLEPVVAELTRSKGQLESVEWIEKRVPVGTTDTLLLSDGSQLFLNSGSRITYPKDFVSSRREIFIDGEVYARVAHDPEHPFLIRSGDSRVQVLGTTFNFKAYGEDRCVECLLMEGSVKMTIDSEKGPREVLMKPGNIVQYDRRSGKVSIGDFQPATFRSFLDGKSLHFYNLTMEDIASELERRFGVRIVVMDRKLSHTRFFAIFNNNESLDRILQAMSAGGRMSVRRVDGDYRLYSTK